MLQNDIFTSRQSAKLPFAGKKKQRQQQLWKVPIYLLQT